MTTGPVNTPAYAPAWAATPQTPYCADFPYTPALGPSPTRKPPAKPAEESADDGVRYRSIKTGGYVSAAYARKHPETVVKETDTPDQEE